MNSIIENMVNEIHLYSEENNQLKSDFISDIKKIQKKQADDLFFLEIKSREIMKIQVILSFFIYIYLFWLGWQYQRFINADRRVKKVLFLIKIICPI